MNYERFKTGECDINICGLNDTSLLISKESIPADEKILSYYFSMEVLNPMVEN